MVKISNSLFSHVFVPTLPLTRNIFKQDIQRHSKMKINILSPVVFEDVFMHSRLAIFEALKLMELYIFRIFYFCSAKTCITL